MRRLVGDKALIICLFSLCLTYPPSHSAQRFHPSALQFHRQRLGLPCFTSPLFRIGSRVVAVARHALQSNKERLGLTDLSGIDLAWRTTTGGKGVFASADHHCFRYFV